MQLATNWPVKRRVHKAKIKQQIRVLLYMASKAYAETLRRQYPGDDIIVLFTRSTALDAAEAGIKELEQEPTVTLSEEMEIEEALFQIKGAREQAEQEEREQREQADVSKPNRSNVSNMSLVPRYYGLCELDHPYYRFSASASEMCRQCESVFRKLWS
jgi:hypothetical protein